MNIISELANLLLVHLIGIKFTPHTVYSINSLSSMISTNWRDFSSLYRLLILLIPYQTSPGYICRYVRSVMVSFRFHQAEVLDQMKVVIKDITAERKTHMIEGAKRINELKLTMDQLDKVGPLSVLTPHPFYLPSFLPLSSFSFLSSSFSFSFSHSLLPPPFLPSPLPSLFSLIYTFPYSTFVLFC